MLTGELVDLRAIEHSDGEVLYSWWNDPEAMNWWGIGAPARSRNSVLQQIAQWLDDERRYEHPVAFIIQTLEDENAGLIVLTNFQPIDRNAELSILLMPSFRGIGLGSDALATLVDAAFDQWGLHRLTARCEAANDHAHRFFLRNGFELEGRLREARFLDGGWNDILIFGCIRTSESSE